MLGTFWIVVLEKAGEGQFDHCVRNEVLHTVTEDRNVLRTV
jgi:hypothetical protein